MTMKTREDLTNALKGVTGAVTTSLEYADFGGAGAFCYPTFVSPDCRKAGERALTAQGFRVETDGFNRHGHRATVRVSPDAT